MSEKDLSGIFKHVNDGNQEYVKAFPGESDARQPVHTVYGGAHLFKSTTTRKLGEMAMKNYQTYLPSAEDLAEVFSIDDKEIAKKIYQRVGEKLRREAVEDFRIDFEDGFGWRPDAEEDSTAVATALEVANGMEGQMLSPFIGIRIKTLSDELKARSLRTLDIFLTTLLKATNGQLPSGFVVTLPKIVHAGQVAALAEALAVIEKKNNLRPRTLKLEFMIETPQSLVDIHGTCALPAMLQAADRRCVAAHFGTYDYTASLSITANQQRMDHPACDFARSMMKVSLAGRGIWLSDGATNVMPVEIHKDATDAKSIRENQENIRRVLRLSYSHVQHSLQNAYYQGWDLHPGQLPVRYIALYEFFLGGLKSATARLKNFIETAAKATLVGDVFDDAATGQGLLNYFLRALNCGAITEDEILMTGLTLEEVRMRSFKKILESRLKS